MCFFISSVIKWNIYFWLGKILTQAFHLNILAFCLDFSVRSVKTCCIHVMLDYQQNTFKYVLLDTYK